MAYFQPILDQVNDVLNQYLFEGRAQFQESSMLLFRAEPENIFHTRAVLPATVEDNYFSGGGKVLHVALQI